jgi:hypothetical protein
MGVEREELAHQLFEFFSRFEPKRGLPADFLINHLAKA